MKIKLAICKKCKSTKFYKNNPQIVEIEKMWKGCLKERILGSLLEETNYICKGCGRVYEESELKFKITEEER